MNRLVRYYILFIASLVGNTNHSIAPPVNFTLQNGTTGCDLCKDITNIIKHELEYSNRTITDIEKIIHMICSFLSIKRERKECYEIDSMIDSIKNMIISGMDPKDICYEIGFCKNKSM